MGVLSAACWVMGVLSAAACWVMGVLSAACWVALITLRCKRASLSICLVPAASIRASESIEKGTSAVIPGDALVDGNNFGS